MAKRRALMDAEDIAANMSPAKRSTDTVRGWWAKFNPAKPELGGLASAKVGRHRLSKRVDVARFLGIPIEDVIDADDLAQPGERPHAA